MKKKNSSARFLETFCHIPLISEAHKFLMKNNSQYGTVYLHDHQYFVMNVNPLTVPMVQLELNDDFMFKTIYLQVKVRNPLCFE